MFIMFFYSYNGNSITYIVSCVGITGRLGSKNAFGRDKRPPWTKATKIHNQNIQI